MKAERRNQREGKRGGSNPTVNFRGEKRSNETHESTTDPEARLARKGDGREAKLSYGAHALMENRNGLLLDLRVSEANGTCEQTTGLEMLVDELPGSRRITVGRDKHYDSADFVEICRTDGITPHVAQNTTNRRSTVDGRTARHAGLRREPARSKVHRGNREEAAASRSKQESKPCHSGTHFSAVALFSKLVSC